MTVTSSLHPQPQLLQLVAADGRQLLRVRLAGRVQVAAVGAVGALGHLRHHLPVAALQARPLPRVLEAVGHDQVLRVQPQSPELRVGALHVGPERGAEDVLAPLAVEVEREQLGAHGVAVRVGLEVAELRAALVVPGPSAAPVLQRELGAGEVVGPVVHWRDCLDDRVDRVQQLLQVLALERGAEGLAVAVLHLEDDGVRPVEHELAGAQLLGPEEPLEGQPVLAEALLLGIVSDRADGLHAGGAAEVGGEEDLLVEVPEVLHRQHHCARCDRPHSQMRVLGAEPGRERARVGAADGDPRIGSGYAVPLVFLEFLYEKGDVLEGLLGVEQAQVVGGEGLRAEGQRLAVEAVFEGEDECLGVLGQLGRPGLVGHAVADALAAEVEQHWPRFGVEVGVGDVVALLPELRRQVAEVVQDLVEQLHLLALRCGRVLGEGIVELPAGGEGQQGEQWDEAHVVDIINKDQSWSMPSASKRLSLWLRSRRGRSSISKLFISSSMRASCRGCSPAPYSSFSSASCSAEMLSLALKACSSHLRRLSSYFSPQMYPQTRAISRSVSSLAALSCSAQARSQTPLKRCSRSRLAALKACLLFLSIWSRSSSAQQLRWRARAFARSQASRLNSSLSMNLRKVSLASTTTFSSFSAGCFEASSPRYSCIFSSASPTSTGAQIALIYYKHPRPMTNRPHSLPRAQRRLLSLHDHRLFADHDALELHRRNIIIDFQQKVRQIEALRDRIAAFPHRRTLNLHGRADSHRERQSQRVIAASSEGQRVGVSNLSISCLVAKEEPRGLTAFQKESMSRMRAKREMMSRKKASTHRTRPLGQGRLQTE